MDPDDEEQVMIQQDLIGFFNSVPHSRICSALQLMTYRLQEHFGQPIEDLTFQVVTKQVPEDCESSKDNADSEDPTPRCYEFNTSWN